MITPPASPLSFMLVRAIYDCRPDRVDELGFGEGDRIIVTAKLNDDWWVSSNFQDTLLLL